MFFPRCPVPYPLRTRAYSPKTPELPPLRRGSPPHEQVSHSSERMYITLSVSACKKRNKSHKPDRIQHDTRFHEARRQNRREVLPGPQRIGSTVLPDNRHIIFRNRGYCLPFEEYSDTYDPHSEDPKEPLIKYGKEYILHPGHLVPARQAIDSVERAVPSPNGYKKPEPRPRQPA